jgi:two-component system, chemotaxis family, CheB/CheR fusion protein
VSYRPLELRRHIDQAQAERRTVRLTDVALKRGGAVTSLEIQVSPLLNGTSEVIGATVAFHDVTDFRRLQDELEQANRQLETAYEELQSTNDELQTINDELQDRTGELDAANGLLETILTSLRAGVVVLNTELHIRVWNRQAQELWGLRPEEAVGQHFLNLDIGLPTDRLRALIRRSLADEDGPQEATVDAVNRRGRRIDVRVIGSVLRTVTDEVGGIILTMEDVESPSSATG